MNPVNAPGYGDYEGFWSTSHPNDPRNGGYDYLNDDAEEEEE